MNHVPGLPERGVVSFHTSGGLVMMWRTACRCVSLALIWCGGLPACGADLPAGFRAIFNGTDLSGWSGEPGRWSVEDGAITGSTTADNPLKHNTFLVWEGPGPERFAPDNFELRLKYRFQSGGNSGIQIRSLVLDAVHPWCVGGYQYDLSPGGDIDALFYEERSRRGLGILPGNAAVIALDGRRWRTAVLADDPRLREIHRKNDWNEAGIRAVGNHIEFTKNGEKVLEVVDWDSAHRRLSGVIALQLHVGGPMKVQFKGIWLKDLPATPNVNDPNGFTPLPDALDLGAESLRSYASRVLVNHDGKTLGHLLVWKAGTKRVWPQEPDLQAFAAGESASAALAAPSADDLLAWKSLAETHGARWLLPPTMALVSTQVDGTVARLPLGHEGGRWFLTTLVTGTPVAGKPDPGQLPRDGDLRSELKVPTGFMATIFARPPLVNYPVFVSAAPDGTLYVSSDGNGSGGRDKHRGRIVRLRDTDGDGRADESVDFVPDVDSPRGVVWDHDRVYVLHPPTISMFRDADGDGVAEEHRVLVENLGFGLDNRSADHTSNGLELGIDGWLYAALGDFGCLNAKGADGTTITLRGGGVVRVRPDGSGLEIFSRGTRNILEAAVSPLLDLFARDNTNDGDGWDVRFHHLTGLDDHGYPRLYKHFRDECVAPVADYGGGSGTGAAWIDEPGIPAEWNDMPFTCDWGRNFVYGHRLTPTGATFTDEQREFFGTSRVNDLDVDANGAIAVTSWRGAQFSWNGPDVGYVVRLTSDGFQPAALPDFDAIDASQLIEILRGASHRRRLEASRAILRRGLFAAARPGLEALAADGSQRLASRVAAIFTLAQGLGPDDAAVLVTLASDPSVAAWAIRGLADHVPLASHAARAAAARAVVAQGLASPDARTRREAARAVARLDLVSEAAAVTALLDDSDPIVVHTAQQVLRSLGAADACFAALDDPAATPARRTAALRVLGTLHEPAVVDGLIARLRAVPADQREARRGLLTALCRQHFIESENWSGGFWGTRPDTRGPVHQPEEWGESKKIAATLEEALAAADADDTVFLAGELARHRLRSTPAIDKLIGMAESDPAVIDALVRQCGGDNPPPARAIPLLIGAAADPSKMVTIRGMATQALARSDDAAGIAAAIGAVAALWDVPPPDRIAVENARNVLLWAPKSEKQVGVLNERAERMDGRGALLADGCLCRMAGLAPVSAEARKQAAAVLRVGLASGEQRAKQIMEAMRLTGENTLAIELLRFLDAAAAHPDDKQAGELARTAEATLQHVRADVAALRAQAAADRMPLKGMDRDRVIQQVAALKGDLSLGEQLFTRQGCVKCHTVKPGEPLKGPSLANAAAIYKRPDLAWAILDPNKSIAQGFATNIFTLDDGRSLTGFVVVEAADHVVVRDATGAEHDIPTASIEERATSSVSVMPAGLVDELTAEEFAALVDYVVSLKPLH
jgi:putative membrane-bound dehydrogenase-like protein